MKRMVFLMVLFLAPALLLAQEKPKLSVSGYILFHFEEYINEDGVYKIAKVGSDYERQTVYGSGYDAFKLTRTYVHFKLQPTGKMLIQVTLDSYQDQNPVAASNKTNGYYLPFIKYAFMEYRFRPEAKVRLGLQQYPWAEYVYNNVWPYLMMERGYFTYWGIYTTADLGASISGYALYDQLQYVAAIFNGEGFKSIEPEKDKEYLGMLILNLGDRNAKINGSLAAEYSSQVISRPNYDARDEGKAQIISAAGVANFGTLKLGGEYFLGTRILFGDTTFPEIDSANRFPAGYFTALRALKGSGKYLNDDRKEISYGGYAGYLVLGLTNKLDLVGRYDFYDPNTSSRYKDDSVQMWMAGLVFKLPAGVQASIDYREYDFERQNLDHDGKREAIPVQTIYTHWKLPF